MPPEATIIINGEARSSITADDGTRIVYSVSAGDDYEEITGEYTLDGADYTLQVELADKRAIADLTGISELYRGEEENA